jgi:predicted glycoside hydrolase/deacetylase ChbG (UPF0249 family)
MSKKLIVNADDFGRTRGVSDGILRAQRDGLVTSTTAMMNLPGIAGDLQAAAREAPQLGLGVHLNFTAGRPLLPVEWVGSLVDERGHFLSQAAVLADPTRINPDELRSELKSQVKTFQNVLERAPDHLDAHHFVHVHPHLFAVYLDLADELQLPIRIPFPRDEAAFKRMRPSPSLISGLAQAKLEAWLREDWQLLSEYSLRTPDHFVASFHAEQITRDHLLSILDDLPEGVTELMTHPGLADDQLRAESSYSLQRETELEVLTDPQIRARVQQLGLEPVTFAVL